MSIVHIRVLFPSQVRDHSEGAGRGEAGVGGGQTTTGERSFGAEQKARSGCRGEQSAPSIAAAEDYFGEAVGGRGAAQFHLS